MTGFGSKPMFNTGSGQIFSDPRPGKTTRFCKFKDVFSAEHRGKIRIGLYLKNRIQPYFENQIRNQDKLPGSVDLKMSPLLNIGGKNHIVPSENSHPECVKKKQSCAL